jgi:hypothetical protein
MDVARVAFQGVDFYGKSFNWGNFGFLKERFDLAFVAHMQLGFAIAVLSRVPMQESNGLPSPQFAPLDVLGFLIPKHNPQQPVTVAKHQGSEFA